MCVSVFDNSRRNKDLYGVAYQHKHTLEVSKEMCRDVMKDKEIQQQIIFEDPISDNWDIFGFCDDVLFCIPFFFLRRNFAIQYNGKTHDTPRKTLQKKKKKEYDNSYHKPNNHIMLNDFVDWVNTITPLWFFSVFVCFVAWYVSRQNKKTKQKKNTKKK